MKALREGGEGVGTEEVLPLPLLPALGLALLPPPPALLLVPEQVGELPLGLAEGRGGDSTGGCQVLLRCWASQVPAVLLEGLGLRLRDTLSTCETRERFSVSKVTCRLPLAEAAGLAAGHPGFSKEELHL